MHIGPRRGPSARSGSRGRSPNPAPSPAAAPCPCHRRPCRARPRRRSPSASTCAAIDCAGGSCIAPAAAAAAASARDKAAIPCLQSSSNLRPSSAKELTNSSTAGFQNPAPGPTTGPTAGPATGPTAGATAGPAVGSAASDASLPVCFSPPKLTKVAARVVVKALRNAIFPPKDNPFVEDQKTKKGKMEAESSDYELSDGDIREENEISLEIVSESAPSAYAHSIVRGPRSHSPPHAVPTVARHGPGVASAPHGQALAAPSRKLRRSLHPVTATEEEEEDDEVDVTLYDDDKEEDRRRGRDPPEDDDMDMEEEVLEVQDEDEQQMGPEDDHLLASGASNVSGVSDRSARSVRSAQSSRSGRSGRSGESGVSAGSASGAEAAAGRRYLRELRAEATRLGLLATRGERELRNAERMPEHAQETLRAATGQARLLLSKKLQQFEKLCLRHVAFHERSRRLRDGSDVSATNDVGEDSLPTTAEDLAGFWDLVKLQVDHVDAMFCEVDRLRRNGWLDRAPPRLSSAGSGVCGAGSGVGFGPRSSPRSTAGTGANERSAAAVQDRVPSERRRPAPAPLGVARVSGTASSPRPSHVASSHAPGHPVAREARESKDTMRSPRWHDVGGSGGGGGGAGGGGGGGFRSGSGVSSSFSSQRSREGGRRPPSVEQADASRRQLGEKASPRACPRAPPPLSPRSPPASAPRSYRIIS